MSFNKKPLVTAAIIFLASTTQAQTNTDLQAVTVYGSRFQEAASNTLPQTNLITATDIQKSGLTNVADVLKKLGNLSVRQDLYGNANASIDMGGFGDAADNNIVVLLDGVRISENEQSSARISLIPIEAIEQIEITRSGNSVLYGDGANGGVINIITKKNLDNLTVISAGAGSYGSYQSNLYTSKKFGDISASVFGSTNNSKGYRDSNQTASQSAGGIIQWQPNHLTTAGLRVFADEQRNSLVGTLPLAWVNTNSRSKQQSIYSEQYTAESSNITFFASTKIDKAEYALDITERNKHSHWSYDKDKCQIYDPLTGYDQNDNLVSYPNGYCTATSPYPGNSYSTLNNGSKTRQINPRVKIDDYLLEGNKLTLGWDWLDWNYGRDVPNSNYDPSSAKNKHSTSGFYLNSDWIINPEDRLTTGYRTEHFKQSKYAFIYGSAEQGSDAQRVSAHNIQYTKTIEKIQLYAKHGKNYRLPNADDNYQLTEVSWRSVTPLKPQTSIDNELGFKYKNISQDFALIYYTSDITNEIGYDENIYGNGNYPSSKRNGIIANGRQVITSHATLRGQIQTINSKILAGTYAGKTPPSVPNYTGMIGLEIKVNPHEIFDISHRTVGKSYFSGDNLNTQNQTSKQHYLDARYNFKQKSWDWTASINNLLNKKQYDYGIYKDSYLPLYQHTVYPTLGRTFNLTGRYVF